MKQTSIRDAYSVIKACTAVIVVKVTNHPTTQPPTHPEKVVLSSYFYLNFNPNLNLNLN